MILTRRALNLKRTRLPLALTLVVCLTGCSSYLESVASNLAADTAAQEAKQTAIATKVVAEKAPAPSATVPDMPTFVKACVAYGRAEQAERAQAAKAKKAEAKTAAKASADTLVLSSLKTDDERRKCTKAVLDYYRSVQKANQDKKAAGKAGVS